SNSAGLEVCDRLARRGFPDADAARRTIGLSAFHRFFRENSDDKSAIQREAERLVGTALDHSFELGDFFTRLHVAKYAASKKCPPVRRDVARPNRQHLDGAPVYERSAFQIPSR